MASYPSISKNIINDIDQKLHYLKAKARHDYHLSIDECLQNTLTNECLNNSIIIEDYNFQKQKDRHFKKSLKRLQGAYRYLKSLSIDELLGDFKTYLCEINSMITGKEVQDYRRGDVEFNRELFENQIARPGCEFVAQYMDELLEELKINKPGDGMHPVQYSAFFQQNFLFVHPYDDGNGRESRLISNFFLNTFDYPCANIEAGERWFYFRLLKEGDESIIEDDPAKGRPFYDYLASKVNNSLDFCIDRIE